MESKELEAQIRIVAEAARVSYEHDVKILHIAALGDIERSQFDQTSRELRMDLYGKIKRWQLMELGGEADD